MNKILQLTALFLMLGILLSCSINEDPPKEEDKSTAWAQAQENKESPFVKKIRKDTVFPPDLQGQ